MSLGRLAPFLGSARNDTEKAADYLLSSSIRKIGNSAHLRIDSGSVISGSMLRSALYAFSSVFIFMNRHSPRKQLSVGPGINALSGISFFNRCNMPASVTIIISRAGEFLQYAIIFAVEQTSYERIHYS